MNDSNTIATPTSPEGSVPPGDREEPGKVAAPVPSSFPGEAAFPLAPALAVSFPKGLPVRVNRRRLFTEREGEVPRYVPESYEATVDRVGATGMIYLIRNRGGVGVVFPDELTPIPG